MNTPTATDFIIFGALGDLSQRKLLPSLYDLEKDQLIPEGSRILCLARQASDTDSFCEKATASLQIHVDKDRFNQQTLQTLLERICYIQLDFSQAEQYAQLETQLGAIADQQRIFYYATAAEFFGTISKFLAQYNCIDSGSRVVLEKPLGFDRESSTLINEEVSQYFSEQQTYRIDHYLGKETVQNLLALRFANPIFGTQWNQNYISHIEITIAESVGIEGRWSYFDKAGQMRDMVQNHLLQLLTLVAMDPPDDLSADSIRDQKVKVLKQLKQITLAEQKEAVVCAQYDSGNNDTELLPGYNSEPGAQGDSDTETFVAIKAEISNWRWAGVPFYLRTGKRMKQKLTQIIVHFKQQPHFIFDPQQRDIASNKLILSLQPNEGVSLQVQTKSPGINNDIQIQPTILDLNFNQEFSGVRTPHAYERLLLEVIKGNQYLFVRRDEIEHAWAWCDNLMQHWDSSEHILHKYPAGSWGPTESAMIMRKDNRQWFGDN
ncbi:glucose-6-phosphate dehydrogenase ['Osedax' symbiont bacterium Rs2_46_30_T18]|nr:glucose-6-phosphate dehydrogenase ['Osedax' symbiont bacterium Rs2_46_30_T18]